ncbi:segregation and condensation protein A [Roseomonas mucosa]
MAETSTTAAAEHEWQENTPPDRRSRLAEMPQLSVEGFEGPLDFLLEMVRRHQLDLGRLSIVPLTDQLVAALEGGVARLERRADWLVMASELLRLRAQLLAPASLQAAEEAAAEADRRFGQLEELAAMKAAAAWLTARPQLGQDVFARGNQMRASAGPQAEMLVAFLEATLAWMEPRPETRRKEPPVYRPSPPDVWTLPEALARLREALRAEPSGGELWKLGLPQPSAAAPVRRRSAAASTFLAGLELARQEEVTLHQDHAFGQINVQLVPPHSAAA